MATERTITAPSEARKAPAGATTPLALGAVVLAAMAFLVLARVGFGAIVPKIGG